MTRRETLLRCVIGASIALLATGVVNLSGVFDPSISWFTLVGAVVVATVLCTLSLRTSIRVVTLWVVVLVLLAWLGPFFHQYARSFFSLMAIALAASYIARVIKLGKPTS